MTPQSDSRKTEPGEQRRFLLMGLPRSGTTFLMSLLQSHRDIYCSSEQFNPYGVVHTDRIDNRHEAILARDKRPVRHLTEFFESRSGAGEACIGFKFMIGHNISVLRHLEDDPDITFIYIWRENRLAQISSLIKAEQTLKWLQHRRDRAHVNKKIDASPRDISRRWHEYATLDHFFAGWLAARPNPRITLEYRELFQPGFNERICEFLGVPPDRRMKSTLHRQSPPDILERFNNPKPIRYYFRQTGHADWLEPEL